MNAENLLALAQADVGLGFSTDPERFMDLVAQGETPARAREMAAMSTCGLALRGWLYELGLADPRLAAPYHTGKVNSDLAAMAREAGALLSTLDDAGPGDIIFLGAPEHVFVIESVDGAVMSTIQGGEKDESGAQCIARMTRSVHGSGRAPLIGGRPVEFMISTEKLCERFMP